MGRNFPPDLLHSRKLIPCAGHCKYAPAKSVANSKLASQTRHFAPDVPMSYSLITAVHAGGKSADQPTLLAFSPRTWPTANREQPRPNGVAGAGYPLPGATPETMAAAGRTPVHDAHDWRSDGAG